MAVPALDIPCQDGAPGVAGPAGTVAGDWTGTAGVAHDVVDDRLAGLAFCNGHTCANTSFPCVLHRADDGTDVLVQHAVPHRDAREGTRPRRRDAQRATGPCPEVRADLAAEAVLGGTGYRWPEDADRLLRRSLIQPDDPT